MESLTSPQVRGELPLPEPAPGWRALLQGRSPKEILSRIVAGDPLRLRARTGRRLEAQALLFDADRVFLRALALCSRAAVRYRGTPAIEEWLLARVDEAIRELSEEGEEAPRPSGTAQAPGAFESLARPLGLDPRTLGRACARFQRLSFPERRAFFDLVLHARSLDELARASGESATEIARRARRGLEVLLAADEDAGKAQGTLP